MLITPTFKVLLASNLPLRPSNTSSGMSM